MIRSRHLVAIPVVALCFGIATSDAQVSDQSPTQVPVRRTLDSLHFTPESLNPEIRDRWTVHRISGSQIMSLPDRSLEYLLPLIPGVGSVNNNLHFRGARANSVVYLVDGFQATNPVTNTPMFSLIPEAMEEVEIHTGAFGVQFGRTLGGIVASRMKIGGDSLRIYADIRTDDFARPGDQFLGTSAFGYRNAVVTASGPLPLGMKFFVAGRHNYWRNRQVMFLEPFRFDTLKDDWGNPPVPGFEFKRNFNEHNWAVENIIQGNLLLEMSAMKIFFLGGYSSTEAPQGEWPTALVNVFRRQRDMILGTNTYFGGARFSHDPTSSLSYSVSAGFAVNSSSSTDPNFGEEWPLYADSIANAALGYTDFRSRYLGPQDYSFWGLNFAHHHSPNNRFQKSQHSAFQVSLDARYRLSGVWKFRGGIGSESWTLRNFSIENISLLMRTLYGNDGLTPGQFDDEWDERQQRLRRGSMDIYGYDFDGTMSDSPEWAPRTPSFQSAYLESSFLGAEYRLIAGLRYERYDLRLPAIDIYNSSYWVSQYEWLNEPAVPRTRAMQVLLPRMSLSVNAGSSARVHFSYGQFAQFVPLESISVSETQLTRRISVVTRGNFYRDPYPGHLLRLERASHIEAGISYAPDSKWTLAGLLYSKSLRDLAQVDQEDTVQARWAVFKSLDEGKASGFEFTITFRPSTSIFSILHYAYTDVNATASDPLQQMAQASYWEASATDRQVYPVSYNRKHVVTWMLDLHGKAAEDAFLNGVDLTLIVTGQSGHGFTREDGIRYLGGAVGLWDVGVGSISDPRTIFTIEPPNASTTAPIINIDLRLSKKITLDPVSLTVAVDILNLLNTRHRLNVFPNTGTVEDDSWLNSRARNGFRAGELYDKVYRTVNLQNRFAYMSATGNDLFGKPRQIRLGLSVEM